MEKGIGMGGRGGKDEGEGWGQGEVRERRRCGSMSLIAQVSFVNDGKRSEMTEGNERRFVRRITTKNYIFAGGLLEGGRAPRVHSDQRRDGKRESKETPLKIGSMGTLIG